MSRQFIKRVTFILGGIAVALPLLALTNGHRSTPAAGDEAATCKFQITANNDAKHEVWVDLSRSTVRRPQNVLSPGWKPLGVQDHRLPVGAKMDRRVEVDGNCNALREWSIHVRLGPRTGKEYEPGVRYMKRTTKDETQRTVYLHNVSGWAYPLGSGSGT